MAEPGIFAKGPVLRRFDEVANDPSQREALLDALKHSDRDLTQIYLDFNIADSQQAAFFRKCWFNPDGANPNSECWWPDHQPVEPIIRQGHIKAMELATLPAKGKAPSRFLPLDTSRVSTGTELQVGISASEHQVACIFLTPALPEKFWEYYRRPEGLAKLTFESPIWVVKRGKESLEPWEVEQEKDDKTKVVTVRLQSQP